MSEIKRVVPPRCPTCGNIPTPCPTCNDYQCSCPNPYQLLLAKKSFQRGRFVGRVHYTKEGYPYPAQFFDGYTPEPFPDDDADLEWLITGETR